MSTERETEVAALLSALGGLVGAGEPSPELTPLIRLLSTWDEPDRAATAAAMEELDAAGEGARTAIAEVLSRILPALDQRGVLARLLSFWFGPERTPANMVIYLPGQRVVVTNRWGVEQPRVDHLEERLERYLAAEVDRHGIAFDDPDVKRWLPGVVAGMEIRGIGEEAPMERRRALALQLLETGNAESLLWLYWQLAAHRPVAVLQHLAGARDAFTRGTAPFVTFAEGTPEVGVTMFAQLAVLHALGASGLEHHLAILARHDLEGCEPAVLASVLWQEQGRGRLGLYSIPEVSIALAEGSGSGDEQSRRRWIINRAMVGYHLENSDLRSDRLELETAVAGAPPVERFLGYAYHGHWVDAILALVDTPVDDRLEKDAVHDWARRKLEAVDNAAERLVDGAVAPMRIFDELSDGPPDDCPSYLSRDLALQTVEVCLRRAVASAQDRSAISRRAWPPDRIVEILDGLRRIAARERGWLQRADALAVFEQTTSIMLSVWLSKIQDRLDRRAGGGLLRRLAGPFRRVLARRELGRCAAWIELLRSVPLVGLRLPDSRMVEPAAPGEILTRLPAGSSIAYVIPEVDLDRAAASRAQERRTFVVGVSRTRRRPRYSLAVPVLDEPGAGSYDACLGRHGEIAPLAFREAEASYFAGVVARLAAGLCEAGCHPPFAGIPCANALLALERNELAAAPEARGFATLELANARQDPEMGAVALLFTCKTRQEDGRLFAESGSMSLPLFGSEEEETLLRFVKRCYPNLRRIVLLGCRAFREASRGVTGRSLFWAALAGGIARIHGATLPFFDWPHREIESQLDLANGGPELAKQSELADAKLRDHPPGERPGTSFLQPAEVVDGIGWPLVGPVGLIVATGFAGGVAPHHLSFEARRARCSTP